MLQERIRDYLERTRINLGWEIETREELQKQIGLVIDLARRLEENPCLAQTSAWSSMLISGLSSLSRFLEDPENLTFFSKRIRLKDLEIDLGQRVVVKNGGRLHLSPREFQVLEILAQKPGYLVSVEQIGEELGKGKPLKNKAEIVRVNVQRLRKVLGDDPKNPRYIESVFKFGHRLMI